MICAINYMIGLAAQGCAMVRLPQSALERRKTFLSKAEEAGKRAAASEDEQARHAWREIAESWQFLADQVVRNKDDS